MLHLRGAKLAGFQAFGPRPRPNAAGPDAPGQAAARPRQPQVRVRMVQINLRALLQLAVMAIILYQVHLPPSALLSVHVPPIPTWDFGHPTACAVTGAACNRHDTILWKAGLRVCSGCLQHCPPGRFLLFATIGLALYVTGPAPLRRAWHRLLAMLPPMVSTVHSLEEPHDRYLTFPCLLI